MKTYHNCYACFLDQSREAARLAGADADQEGHILQCVQEALQVHDPASSPPEMAHHIHQIIRRETGNADPYLAAKAASTREALALYPRLKALVSASDDPLGTAVRLSIAGNVIDFGIAGQGAAYDLDESIERVLMRPLAIDHLSALRQGLASAATVLVLADNTGETVFDRVLIETMGRPVTYAVKGGPILNDATREDALAAGLDAPLVTLVDNGSDAPGTVLSTCSAAFRRLFETSALIIAKGQANYETLSETPAPLFFVLQVKCLVTAQHIGVPVGSAVVKRASDGA